MPSSSSSRVLHARPWSLALSTGLMLTAAACSSSTAAPTPAAPDGATDSTDPSPDADDAAAPPGDACEAAPSKSACKNESSWVRGVARFDPAHIKDGKKPVLRVVLRHSFALLPGEDEIGGRLHAWTSVPVDDPSKGEIPFAIDMCGLGTAMWSEENGAFHLILILDEDGNNDLDDAASSESAIAIGKAGPTELAKMVDVDVSCHAPSACLDVQMDCTGPSCTTIEPIKSCKKRTPGCESDSIFCR